MTTQPRKQICAPCAVDSGSVALPGPVTAGTLGVSNRSDCKTVPASKGALLKRSWKSRNREVLSLSTRAMGGGQCEGASAAFTWFMVVPLSEAEGSRQLCRQRRRTGSLGCALWGEG